MRRLKRVAEILLVFTLVFGLAFIIQAVAAGWIL
jgi:hypothetical protein